MSNLTKDDLLRMQLMGDRILVIEKAPTQTPSGLHLVGQPRWDRVATVVLAGPGFEHHPMPVKVGDMVAIGEHAGTMLNFDIENEETGSMEEVEMMIVRLSGVLAIITEEEETTP